MEDAIGKWAFGAGIAPTAFEHRLWKPCFDAVKTAPASMGAPGQARLAGPVLDRIHDGGEEMVNLAMNDTSIQKYGWCATTDAATVHGEPIMVYSAMRPTHPAPLLLKFANGSKVVSLKGGKGAPEEAEAFLKKLKNTRGGGRY